MASSDDEAGVWRLPAAPASASSSAGRGAGSASLGAEPSHSRGVKRPREDDGDAELGKGGGAASKRGRPASSSAGPDRQRARPRRPDEEEPLLGVKPVLDVSKFTRGEAASTKSIKDLKLKSHMKEREKAAASAAATAARSEMLLTESAGYLEAEGMERTYRFKQTDIAAAVDIAVARRAVELNLDTYGPYNVRYFRSGRHMLLAGAKGHIAIIDWQRNAVKTEFHVRETTHDATFLHSTMMVATAQSKYVHIYDHTGAEVHVLRNHQQPLALDFLPYHFLLASVGNAGWLKYQDVSTGALVAEHRTKLGACSVMRQNPWNAVMCLGHSNGVVTMWTPNLSTPVVRMGAHKGAVTALAVDAGGRYMVTAGTDARVKVWDVRKFQDEPVHSYFLPTPAQTVDISQRGMVGVGYGGHVQVWNPDFGLENARSLRNVTAPLALPVAATKAAKPAAPARKPGRLRFDEDEEADEDGGKAGGGAGAEAEEEAEEDEAAPPKERLRPALAPTPKGCTKATAPYLRHELPGRTVRSLRFRPFDDFLAIGHFSGVSSIIVPGSGEPNFDSNEADPFQTRKGRDEAEVHQLLDKVAPSMISLDPTRVGAVDSAAAIVRDKEKRDEEALRRAGKLNQRDKNGSKGVSKSQRKRLKKNANVVTAQREALRERIKAQAEAAKDRKRKAAEMVAAAGGGAGAESAGAPSSALSRFFK